MNPRVLCFARALCNCHGMLLVLDSDFTPGARIWCLFELALVVERRDTKTPILLDVGTATCLPANMYFPKYYPILSYFAL